MPLIHERTFRVRHYECDAYGHLNGTNYLRYMQETAFDAAAAAGYDLSRHREMGRLWLVRQSGIEYIKPLFYNDTVRVKSWVEDFRRVDSRRAYEFRAAGSDEVVARSYTDWVFLDTGTMRPAPIPQAVKDAFVPERLPERNGRREKIPPAPPPPPGLFHLGRRVEWRDIDALGHVNNAAYLAYAEDCGVQVAAAFGWPMSRCMEAGFGIMVRRHQIDYQRQAVLDDEVEVSTWISDFRQTSAIRHYMIRDQASGDLLVRVRSLYVWVELKAGRLMKMPEDFRAAFAANVAA
jgi:acyl-CoA thioester hydrolase